jgi:hypothetical protein
MMLQKQRSKRWTEANSAIAGLTLLTGVFGCAKNPVLVYVDTEKLITQRPLHFEPIHKPQIKSSQYPINKNIDLPKLSAEKVFENADRFREELRKKLYIKTHKNLVEEILNDLNRAEITEIKKIEFDQKSEIAKKKKELIERSYKQLRQLFLKYSEPAGEAQFKLASIMGFPDADPESLRIPTPSDNKKTYEYNQAKKLRQTLKSLHTGFYNEFHALLNSAELQSESELKELAERILKLYETARSKAEEEAKRITESKEKNAFWKDRNIASTLPKVPGKRLHYSHSLSLNQPDPEQKKTIIHSNRKSILYHVRLWAKINKYTLTTNPNKGQNLTQEFAQWKKQYELEP